MFIFRMAGTKGAVLVPPGTAGAEVNMTRTALRRRPAPSRADLLRRDEGELLALVTGEPVGSAARSAACEILVRRYEALVRSCVLRYRDSPESAEELMQVGYVGLIKAINNFDPALGGSLAAYAQPCISGEIKRHFRDKRWQIRVRRSAQDLLLRVRTASTDLAQELGHAPTDAELASHLGIGHAELAEARLADRYFHAASLDAPVRRAGGLAKLADLLGQDDPGLDLAVDMGAVAAHWTELPPRERSILLMRFYGNMTQAEIGTRLGLSQMHVSRLQAAALRYLRDRLLSQDPAGRVPDGPHGTSGPRRPRPRQGDRHEDRHRAGDYRRWRHPGLRRHSPPTRPEPAGRGLGADSDRAGWPVRPAARVRMAAPPGGPA
jgi:RNA polymerase sigma-B factor